MRVRNGVKIFSAVVACCLCTALLTGFFAQNSVPSPTASPSPSPSTSPTPTPARMPSPTPTPPVAQNFHRWGSVTLFNGLPSDSVRAIAQTADGVMWFGTDNGLARFDGRRVQNYSLGGTDANRILALETRANGELWVGTRAGAFVHSGSGFQPVENTQGTAITAIVGRGDDILRAGTELDVILGTESGLVMVARTEENGVLVSTQLFGRSITSTDGTPVAITGLIQTDHGGIFASTSGRGVFFVDDGIAESESTLPVGSPYVNAIVRDSNLTVWLGIDAARGASGIFAADPDKAPVRISAPTSKVLTLAVNDHGAWAGTERDGLFNFVDLKLKKAYTFANTSGGLRSDTIYTLFTDREGVLWIGTNRGVSRYDPQGPFQENVSDIANSNFIRTLFRASDSKIYAGTNRGVFVKEADEWVQLSAYGNQPIYSIAEDRSKRLVMETEPTQRRSVTAVDGAVWAPAEEGVFRMRDGQTEKVIDAEDVRDIYLSGSDVWAATTTRGLVHARHDDRFGWLVSAIGFEQGLPSEKAFAILPIDDTLLIATNRGVVTHRPGTVAPKLIATRVSSQRVHDLGELHSTIELDYPQNSLLIEVAGQSSRTFPEEFQYGYVLKNAKNEVVDKRISRDSQFAPADLKAGDYRIEVTAFDRDLNASEPLTIAFAVARPPFPWTATALAVLLAIAVIALIWAIVERRRIVLRSRELAAARFDLANEAERERSRIARDLHDQTLADLRDLMMKSDKTLPLAAGFREDIESISTEIRRICEDLSPSVLENVGLIASLEFLLSHTIENFEFDAHGTTDEQIMFARNVQLQIYRVAQEVLTNIATHSDATHVEMSVGINDGQFALMIADDGSLFVPEDAAHKGRGIANIRSRASLINAQVAWVERRDEGNRFSLIIE